MAGVLLPHRRSCVELGGGIALILGWKARWVGARRSPSFPIVVTLIFHNFWSWSMPADSRDGEQISFYEERRRSSAACCWCSRSARAISVDRG